MGKNDLAATALFVAAVRARENKRDTPLFRDELSALLAGREGLARLAASETDPNSNYRRDSFPYLEVRTRYFDNWTQEALRASQSRQIVLLGAGMDTRAFRLPWPDELMLWEVDTSELFSLKEARLQSAGARPACHRTVVETDLTSKGWISALLSSGLEREGPTVWLAEGLFEYLAAPDVDQILEGAASISSSGSRFGAEIISERSLRSRSNLPASQRRERRGTPFTFGTDDPERLFLRHGWVVNGNVAALEAARALGRWPPPDAGSASAMPSPPSASFVTASRAEKRAR